jgi:hypothetical protein
MPCIIAANVRGRIDVDHTWIGPGTGIAGDLVFGLLDASESAPARVLDQAGAPHKLLQPAHVVAVLGPRDASGGVSATLPPGGLVIRDGVVAQWVVGESGIVGCLERLPGVDVDESTRARNFRVGGLLFDRSGRKLSVTDFAIAPSVRTFSRPVLLIAATSSEAGKTTLMGGVIRALTDRGVRVGAIKASGSGGIMDSQQHRQNGAVLVHDFVDAGLITTHGDADIRGRLPLLLYRMEEAAVDAVVIELGGDVVSANNPAVLSLPEIRANTALLAVLCNDALGALGIRTINQQRFGFPESRFRFFTSPFRNHAGMSRRMASVGIPHTFDPRAASDIEGLAAEFAACIPLLTP